MAYRSPYGPLPVVNKGDLVEIISVIGGRGERLGTKAIVIRPGSPGHYWVKFIEDGKELAWKTRFLKKVEQNETGNI